MGCPNPLLTWIGLGDEDVYAGERNVILALCNLGRDAVSKARPRSLFSSSWPGYEMGNQDLPAIMDRDSPPKTDPMILFLW